MLRIITGYLIIGMLAFVLSTVTLLVTGLGQYPIAGMLIGGFYIIVLINIYDKLDCVRQFYGG